MSEHSNSPERPQSPPANNNEQQVKEPVIDKDPEEQRQRKSNEGELVINDSVLIDERDTALEYSSPSNYRSRSRQRSRSRDGSFSPHYNDKPQEINNQSNSTTSRNGSPDRSRPPPPPPDYHGSSSSRRPHREYSDEEEYYYSSSRHRQGSFSPRRRRRSSSRRRYRSRSGSPSRSRRGSGRYKGGCRIYVGNLAYDCRRGDLKSFAKGGIYKQRNLVFLFLRIKETKQNKHYFSLLFLGFLTYCLFIIYKI